MVYPTKRRHWDLSIRLLNKETKKGSRGQGIKGPREQRLKSIQN